MELIDEKYDIKLDLYKKSRMLLSPLESSTFSIHAMLDNVSFDEEEIIDFLECQDPIVGIDCNFGHKRINHPLFKEKPRISSRGRKKKVKVKKNRKYPGDGTCFNSQITFIVHGTHIRKTPTTQDTPERDMIVKKLIGGLESITKLYKIKVFRNGRITTPGILTEDFSDFHQPLTELCKYLSGYFLTPIQYHGLSSVMQNYKCRMTECGINVRNLQKYCEKHFCTLLSTRFSDIVKFFINPSFEEIITPMFEGWNEFLYKHKDGCDFSINYTQLESSLRDSSSVKNLCVDFAKLPTLCRTVDLVKVYSKMLILYRIIAQSCARISDDSYKRIMRYIIDPVLKAIEAALTKDKDNLLSHIKYDPEKYTGFLIKVRTPLPHDSTKKTTVKVFPSGKINIDGANCRKEAEFIYYWLNDLFANHKELISSEIDYDAPDDEFSSDSEDY